MSLFFGLYETECLGQWLVAGCMAGVPIPTLQLGIGCIIHPSFSFGSSSRTMIIRAHRMRKQFVGESAKLWKPTISFMSLSLSFSLNGITRLPLDGFSWNLVFAYFFNPSRKNSISIKRTSHLAGLWIGAAISNTSHSNKAGSTTVKRARLTSKGSRSTVLLP